MVSAQTVHSVSLANVYMHTLTLHIISHHKAYTYTALLCMHITYDYHYNTVDSESVEGFKPGDSDVVIGYQIDEFTCIVRVQIGCVVGICSPMLIPRQLRFSLYSGAVITEDLM